MLLALLKLLQSFVRTLHSDGTPHQIAAGFALGAALGLTPLMNIHNAVIVVLLAIFNVSFGAGLLGMALLAPLGFLLDPLNDLVGRILLTGIPALTPLWEFIDNTPFLALANFNNTVVLGSIVVWAAATVPLYLLARAGVLRYRATYGERIRKSRAYRAVRASKLYNVYSWFRE